MTGTEKKTCRVCGVKKPLDQYAPRKDGRDGTRNDCNDCHNAEKRGRAVPAAYAAAGRGRAATPFNPAAWVDHAACLYPGTDTAGIKASNDRFFLSGSNPRLLRKEIAAAKAVCAGCPVKAECLDHAEKTREWFGIWGGLTPNERVKLRRQRKRRGEAA